MKTGKADIVLITGGGSGIGRGLAERFHRSGATVVICGRRKQKLAEVAEHYPGMITEEVDVSDPMSVKALAHRIGEKFPYITVLVNNAGIQRLLDFTQELPPDLHILTEEIEVNLKGLIHVTAAFLPLLRRSPKKSMIVQIGSGLGFVPLVRAPVYSAAKAAVHSFTMSLREQMRGSNLRVVEIIPPVVETDLHSEQTRRPPNAMKLDVFIDEAFAGLEADEDEIAVGLVKKLRLGSRIAPGFFLKIINRAQ